MIAVIGAGLGGLAAGITLAQAGHEVVVYERHTAPGGFAAGFARGPYRFDASLHALDAVGPGEPNAELLARLGVLHRLRLVSVPTGRGERWLRAGFDVDLPHDRDGYLRAFAALFPESAPAAAQIFALAARVHGQVYAWMHAGQGELDGELLGLMGRTADQLVAATIAEPAPRRLLTSISPYLGQPAERLGAIPFLVLLHGYFGLHAAYPVGGSQALTEALVAELSRLGGRLVLGVAVRRVLTSRRRVRAIDVGEILPVEGVVSNVSPLRTFGALIPDAELPPRWLTQIRALEPSGSQAALHLGVRDAAALPVRTYETIVHELDDPRLPTGRVAIAARHLVDPDAAPPGHGIFELATHVPAQDGEDPPHPELLDALLDAAEAHLLPGLRARIERQAFVHPGVLARYTDAPRGVCFGFAMTPSQSGPRGLPVTTPIDGLVQAGGWVQPGPGQTAVMLSGVEAARSLLGAR